MTAPAYQGFEPEDIPTRTTDGVTVRVVAGELSGLRGVADTHSPVVYAHVTIEPGRPSRPNCCEACISTLDTTESSTLS